jgi:hypothetical protein
MVRIPSRHEILHYVRTVCCYCTKHVKNQMT